MRGRTKPVNKMYEQRQSLEELMLACPTPSPSSRREAPSVPAAFGALAFAGPLPIGAPPSLAVPCTTLHVSVLTVADGWPRRRTNAP